MARQNRVTPFGAIIATPERGTLMGNRGVLHDRDERIRRDWRLTRWILCVLEFKGIKRTVMAPDRYTELFFLDEGTGLAAGHRPCRRVPAQTVQRVPCCLGDRKPTDRNFTTTDGRRNRRATSQRSAHEHPRQTHVHDGPG